MYSILQKVFAVVLAAECFVGITINVFIAAVQIMKWKAVKSLDSCDQILLWLGISRSLSLTNVSLEFLVRAYFPQTSESLIFYTVTMLPIILILYTSSWCATILCVFYCLKFANYHNPVFIYMKTRISRLVPRLIVASLLISLVFTLPLFYQFFNIYEQTLEYQSVGNVTMNYASLESKNQIQLIVFFLGSCLPLFIFCGAVSLLIRSLWLHTRQMRSSGTSFQSPKLEAHFCVVKSMTLFLSFQIIFCIFAFCLFSIYIDVASPWLVLFYVKISAPLFLHSLYMVYSNTKLKQAVIEMFHAFMRCF